MKKILTSSIIITSCVLGVNAFAQTRDSLGYTGAVQNWVVPACITSITIDVYGAQGTKGGGPSCRNFPSATAGGAGGLGGEATGTLTVAPGDTIHVYVGGQGGWNGGGDTGTGYGLEGGFGGGATDARFGGTALANRIIVAGGGGGGGGGGSNSLCSPGTPGPGGDGGTGGLGANGGTGTESCSGSCPTQGIGGDGGTLVAGGTGGAGGTGPVANGIKGFDGSLGLGGMAGGTTYSDPPYWGDATGIGGAGGGGYYGGGGGGGAGFAGGCGAPGGGGGGGSSYTGGVTGGSATPGINAGNGYAIITYNCPLDVNNINILEDGVKFYPNPFTGIVNVNVNVSGPVNISMYNMLGENMGTWQVNRGLNLLNKQSIPAGVYTMQIKTKEGVLNKKLVKMN
jgi:hypothetical protein